MHVALASLGVGKALDMGKAPVVITTAITFCSGVHVIKINGRETRARGLSIRCR